VRKEKTEFTKRENRPKGVVSRCKQCMRSYQKKWVKNNREGCKERSKKYYENNREARLEYRRMYYQDTQEERREYARNHYYENIERYREYAREYSKNNASNIKEYNKKWIEQNKDYVRKRSREWCRNNPAKIRKYWNQRQKHIWRATPCWADMEEINRIYEECARVSKDTGVMHHVDHIIPLTNEKICGLHVPGNLQILTASENCKKHNKFKSQD
jgi:hypothetical protein